MSIDPENAKYRHALGLAKCATGDEAGAREDLLEAALLDEEDAEDRYQLRMRRENEARKKLEKQSTRQGSEEVAGQVSGPCSRGPIRPCPCEVVRGRQKQNGEANEKCQ